MSDTIERCRLQHWHVAECGGLYTSGAEEPLTVLKAIQHYICDGGLMGPRWYNLNDNLRVRMIRAIDAAEGRNPNMRARP